jgi:ABC-2 type transport system ATP-binding protein
MIELNRLTKVYGSRVAVWNVTFEVKKGEILGFLGPNGAGKTTTMRMVTGFIPPSSGTATVAGFNVAESPLEVKKRIGYLCEMPPVYREMVVLDYLGFVAEIKQVPRSRVKPLIDRAVQLTGLEDVSKRVIGNLSKGYRQRVGLAQAVLHEPEVLILDEPTVGLDPRQIIEIRERIRELGGEQTVILSTHILPEVRATCSRVVVINEGQIVAQDSIEGLMKGLDQRETMTLQVSRAAADLHTRLAQIDGVESVVRVDEGMIEVTLTGGAAAKEVLARTVIENGAGLTEMVKQRASLEEVFLNIVREDETPGATV